MTADLGRGPCLDSSLYQFPLTIESDDSISSKRFDMRENLRYARLGKSSCYLRSRFHPKTTMRNEDMDLSASK